MDFLTILGEHEGEGLVADAEAEVAGSRSAHMADKGQKVPGMLGSSPRCLVADPTFASIRLLPTMLTTERPGRLLCAFC